MAQLVTMIAVALAVSYVAISYSEGLISLAPGFAFARLVLECTACFCTVGLLGDQVNGL